MKKFNIYLYFLTIVLNFSINSKASSLGDIPDHVWENNLAPALRAADLCKLSQVSKSFQKLFRNDLLWKPVVARYYPKPMVDLLYGQYYSTTLKMLDNRRGITYNNRQYPEMSIEALNFDGTIMVGKTRGKPCIAKFENNNLSIIEGPFEGNAFTIDFMGSVVGGEMKKIENKDNTRHPFFWNKDSGFKHLEFDTEIESGCLTNVSGNGQIFAGEFKKPGNRGANHFACYDLTRLPQINIKETSVNISTRAITHDGMTLAGSFKHLILPACQENQNSYLTIAGFQERVINESKVSDTLLRSSSKWILKTNEKEEEVLAANGENSQLTHVNWDGTKGFGFCSTINKYFTWKQGHGAEIVYPKAYAHN